MVREINRKKIFDMILNPLYLLVVFSLPFLLIHRPSVENDTYFQSFIDSRVELFLKKINKKEDIFTYLCAVCAC